MDPTPSDVHVNMPLTNISIAFIQSATTFVASRVFPIVGVRKQSDRYYTYDRGDMTRDEMELRAPGAESAGAGYRLDSTPTYYCHVRGLHKDIPDEVRANEDSVLNSDRDASIFLTQKGLINREVNWVSKYFTASVWTNDLTGAASSPTTGQFLQWDAANSTPIEDIRTGRTTVQELTGFRPNCLVVGQHVLDALVDHADIVDRIKYSGAVGPDNAAIVNERTLAQLFGVDEVIVAGAIKTTSNEGSAADTFSFIAGKHALLCYRTPSPGIMVPTAGYTFAWTARVGASMASEGFTMSKFRRASEYKADRVEIESSYDQKLVSADLGYFFGGAVA